MKLSLAWTALFFCGCVGIPSVAKSGVRYQAVPSVRPVGSRCLNAAGTPAVAKEILDVRRRMVMVAGGPHPISDSAWRTFQPGLFLRKNSDRHLLFRRSCFYRSPDAPADCEGDACRRISEIDGYTWVHLAQIVAMGCIPRGRGGCSPAHVEPGRLAVIVLRKCHQIIFEGSAIELFGPRGERAVMHATADGHPTLDVPLPKGWRLQRVQLTRPLVLNPFGGDGQCYYNVLRDSRAQSYHQFRYAAAEFP